jgi:hypothetical protein
LYPARILVWTWWYAWPAVLALCLIVTTERRKRVGLVALYLAAFVPIAFVAQAAGVYVLLMFVILLVLNSLGTLLLLALLSRRVRSVGPLVLAITVVALTGATLVFLLVMVLFRRDNPLILAMASSLGAGVFYLAALFGLTLAALLGALLLVWIRRSYQAKRISDQSILLDAMWLFFAVFSSWLYLPWSWTGLLAAAAAFVGYKLVVNAGLASAMRPVKEGAPGPTLLLLRVFSLGRRSERLFDILSQRWLRLGSIALIAGEDLATTTIEPHEFLAFLSGRLSRQFVSGKADLEQRLRDLDTRPDADGRYRVNEFFCRGDTWQMTMRELTARSDAILMDLRSFGPTNQGCIYELEQLLGIAPLERIVLLVDDTTDRPFLEQTLRGLWAQVPSDSPNRGPRPRGVRLFHVSGGSEGEVQVLLQLLCGARTQPQKDMSIQPAG